MLYLLYKMGLFALRLVTTETAYAIVTFFARLKYFFSIRDRELVRANLRRALPGAGNREISSLAKEVFENFGRYLVDFFSLMKSENNYLERAVRLVGTENLDEALKAGKGCILLTGHFGNWELAGCAIANAGYKISVVALEHADPRIDRLFTERREKAGMHVTRIGTARAVCQNALRRGEIIGIMGDRPYGDRGTEVSFFGRPAIVPRSAALFSLKYGSPIITFFAHRKSLKVSEYEVVFDKAFFTKRNGPIGNQLRDIAERFIRRFECAIRKYPSQWYMFNKVWKGQ